MIFLVNKNYFNVSINFFFNYELLVTFKSNIFVSLKLSRV